MVQIKVVEYAHQWIGTPYVHQASLKQKGCDCIGLILGVWREVYNKDPEGFKLPTYSPSWAEETKKSLLIETSRQYFNEIAIDDIVPGDVVMYKMLRTAPPKHCAIVASPAEIIHAYQGHGTIKTPFLTGRTITLTNAFRFLENI